MLRAPAAAEPVVPVVAAEPGRAVQAQVQEQEQVPVRVVAVLARGAPVEEARQAAETRLHRRSANVPPGRAFPRIPPDADAKKKTPPSIRSQAGFLHQGR